MCSSNLHVEGGGHVEAMGREDDTPIHSAARDGDLATVKDLVAEGFGGCPPTWESLLPPAMRKRLQTTRGEIYTMCTISVIYTADTVIYTIYTMQHL